MEVRGQHARVTRGHALRTRVAGCKVLLRGAAVGLSPLPVPLSCVLPARPRLVPGSCTVAGVAVLLSVLSLCCHHCYCLPAGLLVFLSSLTGGDIWCLTRWAVTATYRLHRLKKKEKKKKEGKLCPFFFSFRRAWLLSPGVSRQEVSCVPRSRAQTIVFELCTRRDQVFPPG